MANLLFQLKTGLGSGKDNWVRGLQGSLEEYSYGIVVNSNGDAYVAGSTNSSGAGGRDALLIKYDNQGNLLWQKALGDANYNEFNGICLDSNENIIASGHTSDNNGNFFVLVVKFDSNGNIIWQRRLGNSGAEYSRDVDVDSNDNIFVAGHTESVSGNYVDFLMIKMTPTGSVDWQKTVGRTQGDYSYGVAIDSNDDVIFSGTMDRISAQINNSYVIKLDNNGNSLWQRLVEGDPSYNVSSNGLSIGENDTVYFSSYIQLTTGGETDMSVLKFSSQGDLLWQKRIGGIHNDYGGWTHGFDFNTNHLYISGSTVETDGTYSLTIHKIDFKGNIVWQRSFKSAGANDIGKGNDIFNNNLYVTGISNQASQGYDILVLKLAASGSGTGTCGNFSYNVASYPVKSNVLTSSPLSLTVNNSSLTLSTTTLTLQTATLTPLTHC